MITIRFDRQKPMASVEFVVRKAPPNYPLTKTVVEDRSEIQPVLSSLEFKALVDGVRSAFETEVADGKFEVLRVSGIVFHDVNVYRPGILLLLQEREREGTIPEKGRERVTAVAEAVREQLGMA